MKPITPLANRSDYTWEFFAPYYEELLNQPIYNDEDMLARLDNEHTLDSLSQESYYKIYIANACNMTDQTIKQQYDYMVNIFEVEATKIGEKMRNKVLSYDTQSFVEKYPERKLHFKILQKSKDMYREENIELSTQIQQLSNKYSTLMSEIVIIGLDGEKLTVQQAFKKLQDPDQNIRKRYYDEIIKQRMIHIEECDRIFDQLLFLRNQKAKNSGYENFLTYTYDAKGRFDYTFKDVLQLCDGIKHCTRKHLQQELLTRKQKLGADILYPYDLSVDIDGKTPLTYGKTVDELLSLARTTLSEINQEWVLYFDSLQERGNLDLGTRQGKRGGGFHITLGHTESSFILMNASERIRDFFVLMHEFGHATHAHLARKLRHKTLATYSIETAEVASMSMECFALEAIKGHFEETDYRRLVKEHCDDIISTLTFIAEYEEFQSRLYTAQEQDNQSRKILWASILREYSLGIVDWSKYEDRRSYSWHSHAHVFRSPFYNIEYAFAQLAAVQFWMKYRENKEQALADYTAMLSSGFTRGVRDTYKIGGVSFITEQDELQKIIDFVVTMSKENS